MDKVFESIKIGSLSISNRFVVPPMVTNYANTDGTANERFIAYLEERAKGGFGLIIPENYSILEEAKGFKNVAGLWHDSQIESHKQLTDRVHQYDSKIFAQLNHAGRQTSSKITGIQPVAPSALADPVVGEVPRALTLDQIEAIIDAFAQAALRAKKAGFDGVEIHGCHGYLINQFLSPFSNKRDDKYGGSTSNRTRFALEVVEAVRQRVGDDYPIIFRLTVNEYVEEGLTAIETKKIAKLLEKAGVDAIHASNGIYASNRYIIPPAGFDLGWSTDITAVIKEVVSIPVITVGRIVDPEMADQIIESSKADMISMGRASLADPHLPNKAKEGKSNTITKCIACLKGCVGKNTLGLPIECVLNPLTGYESTMKG